MEISCLCDQVDQRKIGVVFQVTHSILFTFTSMRDMMFEEIMIMGLENLIPPAHWQWQSLRATNPYRESSLAALLPSESQWGYWAWDRQSVLPMTMGLSMNTSNGTF